MIRGILWKNRFYWYGSRGPLIINGLLSSNVLGTGL
jgi:hypothetical protein